MNFCFWFLQKLLTVWETISNIQKPQSWFKKTRLHFRFFFFFQLTSQCLEIGCNTLNRVGHTDLKFLTAWTNVLITRNKSFHLLAVFHQLLPSFTSEMTLKSHDLPANEFSDSFVLQWKRLVTKYSSCRKPSNCCPASAFWFSPC